MGQLVILPRQRVLSNSIHAQPGALCYVYEPASLDPITTYADAALTTPQPHPVAADAYGTFPPMYVSDDVVNYKIRLTGSTGGEISTDDAVPVRSPPFAMTDAEIAAAIPIETRYRYGDIRRYGALESSSDNTAAMQAALDLNGVAYVPAGTWLFGSTVTFDTGNAIIGEGYKISSLKYTGSGTAIASVTPSARTYGQRLYDFTLLDGGTGTVGLDMGSISSADVRNVLVIGFTTGISLTGSNGYCLYNRFLNVTAWSATTGWAIGGNGSNSNTLAFCRTGYCTTGVYIYQSNQNYIVGCQFEQGTTGIFIDAASASLADRNTITGNRFEQVTTNIQIGTAAHQDLVRETAVIANHHVTGTGCVDYGQRTLLMDPFGLLGPSFAVNSVKYSSLTGNFQFERSSNAHLGGDIDDPTITPAFVVRDSNAATGNPVTLQVETERYTGLFFRGMRGGSSYFEVNAYGQIIKQKCRSGAAAPSVDAYYIGEIYVDTTGSKAYIAKSVGSGASDWMVLN